MTAPDPTPYAAPTDLRTAEDAAWWLRIDRTERLKAYRQDGGRGVFPCDADLLYARIERERRQACRRGALDRWRAFSIDSREYARQKRDEGLICDSEAEYYIERHLSDALAFRAAARAK